MNLQKRIKELELLLKNQKEAADHYKGQRDELRRLLNTPHTKNFINAIRIEAVHQILRWGERHDEEKTDPDWLWLVAYLCTKALKDPEKKLHHIITTAAACMNWHRHITKED